MRKTIKHNHKIYLKQVIHKNTQNAILVILMFVSNNNFLKKTVF